MRGASDGLCGPAFLANGYIGGNSCQCVELDAGEEIFRVAASYALAAHEIGLIKEQSLLPDTPEKFSLFVGDAENAFSREHTQWVARKDV